jgi:DNA-binding CsgD family transcriptional regulator
MATGDNSGTVFEAVPMGPPATVVIAREPFDRVSLFLTRRPSASEICKFLVLSMPLPDVATGCMLSRCLDDGFIDVVGSFGYPAESIGGLGRISIFDHTPITDAARDGRTTAVDDVSMLREPMLDLPPLSVESDGKETLLAVPLLSDSGSIGVLSMTFLGTLDQESDTIATMEALAGLVTVYMVMSTQHSSTPNINPAATQWEVVDIPGVSGVRVGLTKRQQRVLSMLARKLSNPQIALALDYSVSTIRLDTMAIYRFFGVGNRREAVEEATRRGILRPPPR